ncbi:uncharacterized protein LOC127705041 isoform X2 [Mytilus californianus]|uniref:uncharacterized protein LOC127705041 isoform X2 n=1 Tax=Mytilus californianus TaxID=6549 RepID=UPI002247BC45|nr:uncharacterized protein LOC127705041 isoform X2 [Mytilus californianus]
MMYLYILDPPLVNIKVTQIANHVKLDCIPQGVPDIYTFEPWEHTTAGGQHIRFLIGYQNGTLVLNETKSENTLQDTGIYICSVRNGISDSNGRFNQTGHVPVNRNGYPIFGNKNRASQFGTFGHATTLNFDVYRLEAEDLIIKDKLNRKCDFGSQIKIKVNISVVFHGTEVDVEGLNIKIKTQPLTGEDFGNYTVTALSRFGNSTYHFTLQSATSPLSPHNVTLTTAATKICVSWSRNFDGGYQQEFFILLLTTDLVQLKKYGPLKDTMQRQQSFTLNSVEAGITYYIRMFSKNKIGHSNLTEVSKVTTMDTFRVPSEYVLTSMSAVCILTIVAVGVFYKIWKAKRNSYHEDDDAVIQPLGNQYHVDNVLYQSQEEINLSGGGGGDGYSKIDRSDAILPYGAVVSYSAQCSSSDDGEDYENVTGKSGKLLNEGERNAISIKDDHVLNYSEVVFSPCESSRFVIHGSNNKTVYADVDLSLKAVALPYTDDESSDDASDFDDVVSWVKTNG